VSIIISLASRLLTVINFSVYQRCDANAMRINIDATAVARILEKWLPIGYASHCEPSPERFTISRNLPFQRARRSSLTLQLLTVIVWPGFLRKLRTFYGFALPLNRFIDSLSLSVTVNVHAHLHSRNGGLR
jgi:hypothetical protein